MEWKGGEENAVRVRRNGHNLGLAEYIDRGIYSRATPQWTKGEETWKTKARHGNKSRIMKGKSKGQDLTGGEVHREKMIGKKNGLRQ